MLIRREEYLISIDVVERHKDELIRQTPYLNRVAVLINTYSLTVLIKFSEMQIKTLAVYIT